MIKRILVKKNVIALRFILQIMNAKVLFEKWTAFTYIAQINMAWL